MDIADCMDGAERVDVAERDVLVCVRGGGGGLIRSKFGCRTHCIRGVT